jgi:hypothetical protein
MRKPFASIDNLLVEKGKVRADCGHQVDVRKLVYVHLDNGVTHCCEDCAKDYEDYR